MGNIISSFFSGFTKVIGDLFGSPLDFLSGKSCSSVCQSTWDFICYIENFCVANLLKIAMVLFLIYIVLLFVYLLYKLGICWCIGHSLCKILWACLVSWFTFWEYCCTFLCLKLIRFKRRNKFIISEGKYYSDERFSSDSDSSIFIRPFSRPSRDYRQVHFRKSLRPRNHHVRVGIQRDSRLRNHGRKFSAGSVHQHVRVTHSSKFVKKGRYNHKRGYYGSRRC